MGKSERESKNESRACFRWKTRLVAISGWLTGAIQYLADMPENILEHLGRQATGVGVVA